MAQTIKVKVTSAFAVDGTVHKAGQIVDVPDKLARNLLHRDKVVLAAAETPDEAPDEPTGPIGTNGRGGAKRQGKVPADESKGR